MLLRKKVLLLFFIQIALLTSGCQYLKKDIPSEKDAATAQDGYYSVKGFLDDQWNLLEGQPYVLLRVADFNNTTDSSYIPLDSTLWHNIRKQFDASDISDGRFLDQYRYTAYPEESLHLIYLNYEAKNDALFTQNLNVGIDDINHKIRSVFIETQAHSRTYEKKQQLTYLPRQLIRIQTFEKSVVSRPERLTITYYFKYE